MNSSIPDAANSVLIVEDDARLGALLVDYLGSQGFRVGLESDGQKAIDRIRQERPTAVILDLFLPRVGGIEVLRTVRPTYHGGVLILTANKTQIDEILGLELGADDYVTKPVEPRLLLARLRSLLRRLSPNNNGVRNREEKLSINQLSLDRTRREVLFANQRIELTSVEFSLLWLLASYAGEVVSRDDLYSEGLGTHYDGIDRGVDVHISRLRKKLADKGFDPADIKSIRGAGYLLAK